ncbi:hypothetical protein EBZ39_06100 [bacterium]|jgi:hypothetical protein|nr:hypothetical protein [bacterium]
MPYAQRVRDAIEEAPKTLGNQLGRWAVHLDFPVTKIAKSTGATRQTVYNWFNGGEVTPAYRNVVQGLLEIMQTSSSSEDAWRKICNHLNLQG